MAKAFVFKKPKLTITNLRTKATEIITDEELGEDGITLSISSEVREVSRFSGTDRFPSGKVDVSGEISTILEGEDIWKMFKKFNITGMEVITLKGGKVGVKVGGGETCGSADPMSVVIEDVCDTAPNKRIKLMNVEFNTEDVELAISNSDGITPTIAMYCNADEDGIKALLGFDTTED